jgi:hypothetical protein
MARLACIIEFHANQMLCPVCRSNFTTFSADDRVMAMVSNHHRQLVDGVNADEYNYYAEPADDVKPEGKTILLLTIFGILVAISIGYFIANLLFPGLIKKIEGRDDSAEEQEDEFEKSTNSYQPPRPNGGEIAMV